MKRQMFIIDKWIESITDMGTQRRDYIKLTRILHKVWASMAVNEVNKLLNNKELERSLTTYKGHLSNRYPSEVHTEGSPT